MSAVTKKMIVIGNGMAGIRFLEEIRKNNSANFDVSVFGEEPHSGYNRVLLSPLLAGEQSLNDIITHPKEWYQDNEINLHSGKKIVDVDRHNKTIKDDEGTEHSYDTLVIATGSHPFVPPIPGNQLNGVYTYRTIEDVESMTAMSKTHAKAVVIGGGLLGLEAAYGLKQLGMQVTVIHRHPILMEKQLNKMASDFLVETLKQKGIEIILSGNTKMIQGDEQVKSVILEDDTEINTDIVVIAVGIRPNTDLGNSTGLDTDRGLVVNEHLQTSDTNIYALGECAQFKDSTYGLVAPLYEQAAICAQYVCGDDKASYHGSITSTRLKVTGIHLFSAGQFNEDADCKLMQIVDEKNGIYRKLVIKNNRLIGALLYGDIHASNWYQDLIVSKEDVSPFSDVLMFGPEFIPENNEPEELSLAS